MTSIQLGTVLAAVVAALGFAAMFFRAMLARAEGTERMRVVSDHIQKGALAYLHQQHRVMLTVFCALATLFAILAFVFDLQSRWLPVTFLAGGLSSALAGFVGMTTATRAAVRTAAAARSSLALALQIAFRSGAVMGLTVVGLGLGSIVGGFWLLGRFTGQELEPGPRMVVITTTLLTFGMGASLQALFARVGGGIYTKAADVGADLVGKVEKGIPEDDPRNPATIADNVGDNVGDVAGMGADLFESYCGSILAACALGAAAYIDAPDAQAAAVVAPVAVAALGIVLSIAGIFAVRSRDDADGAALLTALSRGVYGSAAGIGLLAGPCLYLLEAPDWSGIWAAIVTGLITGIVIGRSTEYSTSSAFAPTRGIAKQAEGGPATLIIAGLGTGMLSTAIPVAAVATSTVLAFLFGSGFSVDEPAGGLYGVAMAAVGMLSTLGITLATDAYGPIADNAGGNAEMCELGPAVRARTDMLDELGNTTAATGKGFAIGSAALTALALVASYIEVIRVEMIKNGTSTLEFGEGTPIETTRAGLADFIVYFDLTLLNPVVLAGLFAGAMITFVFSGLTIRAVGRAAALMVAEVRRQFRDDPGILKGTSDPDYARCIAISTVAAQREMIVPSLIALATPVLVGLVLGVAGVIGLLLGALVSGFVLAVFLSNAGGAFDNAKKYIEAGHHGGKNSAAHRASVIGDTLGDPFKDTAGPSLNILIKLMSIVTIVTAGMTISMALM